VGDTTGKLFQVTVHKTSLRQEVIWWLLGTRKNAVNLEERARGWAEVSGSVETGGQRSESYWPEWCSQSRSLSVASGKRTVSTVTERGNWLCVCFAHLNARVD
jgi:hypothetical protein